MERLEQNPIFEFFKPRDSHHGVDARLALADLMGDAVIGSHRPQWGLDTRTPTCMYPVQGTGELMLSECGQDASRRSHSISRARTLRRLCYGTARYNQTVYRPFPDVASWAQSMSNPRSFAGSALPSELTIIDPEPIGIGQASTGHFSCNMHDGPGYFGKADAFDFCDYRSYRTINEGNRPVRINDLDDVLFMLLARTFYWQSALVRGVRSLLKFFETIFAGRCEGCRQRFLRNNLLIDNDRMRKHDPHHLASDLVHCEVEGCLLTGNAVWQDTVLRVATVGFGSRARDYFPYGLLFRRRILNAGECEMVHHIIPFNPIMAFASAEVDFLPYLPARGPLGEVPAVFVHIFCSSDHGVAILSYPRHFSTVLRQIIDEKASQFKRGRHDIYVRMLSRSFNAYVAREAYDDPTNAPMRRNIQQSIVNDFVAQMADGLTRAVQTFTSTSP